MVPAVSQYGLYLKISISYSLAHNMFQKPKHNRFSIKIKENKEKRNAAESKTGLPPVIS